MFNLECLDERIVLSAVGAEAHVAALIATGHVKAAAAIERHEARIEARHDAKVSAFEIAHSPSPVAPPSSPTAPIVVNPPNTNFPQAAASTTTTSTSSSTGTTVTLPPNVSSQLQSLYAQYESYLSTNSSGTFTPTGLNMLIIKGNDVGINFQTSDSADFNTILSQLQSDGMQVNSSSSYYGVIEGMLPIAQLPAVAQLPSASVTPMYPPMMN
jgi:hypothetical protein